MASEIPEPMTKGGGENMKFFHHLVIQNRIQNKIFSFKNSRGERVETREEIEATLNIHFLNILRDPR